MVRFLLGRITSSLLVLCGLLILAFVLQHALPGDPTDQWFRENDQNSSSETERADWRQRLGLDLPLFYLSLGTWADHGQGGTVESQEVQSHSDWHRHLPMLHWNPDNRFHRWIFGDGVFSKGLIRGDFGISWNSRQPVMELIGHRIGWSVFLTLFSLVLAYVLSYPVALRAMREPGGRYDRSLSRISNLLLSLPVFWVAVLLLLLFANPHALQILPVSGISPAGGWPETSPWLARAIGTIPYIVLPTIAYCYGSWAFLSAQFRETLQREMQHDYFRTGLAKGLRREDALRIHAFRNTWIQAFALFGFAFPAAIGGSIVIESVFSIPGMGYTIYEAIDSRDYPVMNAVFLLSGSFTIAGLLISDLLVYRADPRIHSPSSSTREA